MRQIIKFNTSLIACYWLMLNRVSHGVNRVSHGHITLIYTCMYDDIVPRLKGIHVRYMCTLQCIYTPFPLLKSWWIAGCLHSCYDSRFMVIVCFIILLLLCKPCFCVSNSRHIKHNNDDFMLLGRYTLWAGPTGPITGPRPKGPGPVIGPAGPAHVYNHPTQWNYPYNIRWKEYVSPIAVDTDDTLIEAYINSISN
jgi:hypothetical protein